jgi:hypothetical protein
MPQHRLYFLMDHVCVGIFDLRLALELMPTTLRLRGIYERNPFQSTIVVISRLLLPHSGCETKALTKDIVTWLIILQHWSIEQQLHSLDQ